MCGIAGFTHLKNPRAPGVLREAIESIRHRGPNQQGVFESESVSLGAVRLKIIDLEGGDQPMVTNDGDLVIVFNGEIYNHVALRRELETLGHQFLEPLRYRSCPEGVRRVGYRLFRQAPRYVCRGVLAGIEEAARSGS